MNARRTALENHSFGLVHVHDLGHNGLEEVSVGLVVDAVLERHIHSVALTGVCSSSLSHV